MIISSQKQRAERFEKDLPTGSFYNVEGRRLLLDHHGSGSPAVVFIPAAGMVGLDYLNIHHKMSQHTTSVIYDRLGTGWSDPIKLPRSALKVTDELRNVLQVAGIPAPYLFVGHSLGGIYAHRYAQRFPNEVAGMILLEPPHEDFLTNTPKFKKRYLLNQGITILRALFTYKKDYRLLFQKMFASWPDDIQKPLIEYHLKTLSKTMTERKNLNNELYEEIRKGDSLPDIPMIVFTAMGIDPFTIPITSQSFLRDTIGSFNNIKNTVYTKLANTVPRGEHRILENAGHTTIHTDSPDEVVKAIRNLIHTHRAFTDPKYGKEG